MCASIILGGFRQTRILCPDCSLKMHKIHSCLRHFLFMTLLRQSGKSWNSLQSRVSHFPAFMIRQHLTGWFRLQFSRVQLPYFLYMSQMGGRESSDDTSCVVCIVDGVDKVWA